MTNFVKNTLIFSSTFTKRTIFEKNSLVVDVSGNKSLVFGKNSFELPLNYYIRARGPLLCLKHIDLPITRKRSKRYKEFT